MERKLAAVDQLWSEVLQLRNTLPLAISFIDIFQDNEISKYQKLKESSDGSQFVTKLSQEEFQEKLKVFSNSTENMRPYVGDYLWAVFNSYKVIHMRLLVILQTAENEFNEVLWYKDEGTYGIIKAVLSEEELKHFDELKIGKFAWLNRQLEFKILSELRKVISGEHFGEDALKQVAADTLEKINEVQRMRGLKKNDATS